VKVLRTPESCFDGLAGHPFEPRYAEVDAGDGTPAVRMGYVEAGPQDGTPVVLLHDAPTWSYAFRDVIPALGGSGFRVLAPDLVGFGRSDKPSETADHTLERHVAWTTGMLGALGLSRFALVGCGWGGMVGLRLTATAPERVDRLVAVSTGLPTGDRHPGDWFLDWQSYVSDTPELRIGAVVDAGCARTLTASERSAYDAPFPDEHHKAGPRAAPLLVPTQPHDPATPAHREAWEVLRSFDRPVLRVNGAADPVARWTEELGPAIPGAARWSQVKIAGASHRLAEDRPDELAQLLVGFLRADPDDPPAGPEPGARRAPDAGPPGPVGAPH